MSSKFLRLLLAFSCLMSVNAQAQSSAPPIEYRRYEDWYTFKNGEAYTADPYVWAYTKEFSNAFRMPEKWIEPELKGALAVAFRMTTIGRGMCGLARKEDNCWPTLECQMDIYYDNSIKLPWVRPEITKDFLMDGISSHEYLYDKTDQKAMRRYVPKDNNAPMGVMNSGGVLKIKEGHGSGANIAYYDREYQSGIGLIGYVGTGVCPHMVGIGSMNFFDIKTSQKMREIFFDRKTAKPMHTIIFPETFMRRAHAAYERDNQPNNAVTDRLMKPFINAVKPAVPVTH